MSKLKAIINGLLATQYKLAGLDADTQKKVDAAKKEIAELISADNDDDIDETALGNAIANLDKLRVGKIHNDSYSKGKKEELSKYEKIIRDKLAIDDEDLKGEELVNRVSEIISEHKTAAEKSGGIKDEDIEKHPKFVAMVKEKDKAIKKTADDAKIQYDKLKADHEKEKAFQTVSKDILSALAKLNPVKLSSEESAKAQETRFLNDFSAYEFKQEGGKWIPYKDGEPLKDEHGNFEELDTLVASISKLHYDFPVNDKREFPDDKKNQQDSKDHKSGESKKDQQQQKKYTGKMPTNENEYLEKINDRSLSIAERTEINDHWDNLQKKSKQPA